MKLTFDTEFNEWLSGWNKEFDWDDGNKHKNEKHEISASAIERIFQSRVYVAGKILETGEEARWLLLGEVENKDWALIVTRREAK